MSSDNQTCPRCSAAVASGQNFCSNCGLKIGNLTEAADIDEYISARLEQELNTATQEKDYIPAELAQKADEIILKRLTLYLCSIGFIFVIAGFLGVKSIEDVKNKLIKQVSDVKVSIDQEKKEINLQRYSINENKKIVSSLQNDLKSQKIFINDRMKDINLESSKSLQIAHEQFTDVQKISDQVQALKSQIKTTSEQISTKADDLAIDQHLKDIGQQQYVTYDMQPWKGAKDKPSSQKWLSVDLSPLAKQKLTREKIMALQAKLKSVDIIPYLGVFGTNGTYYNNFYLTNQLRPGQACVIYFDPNNKKYAEEVAKIASDTLSLQVCTEIYHSVIQSDIKSDQLIINTSGLDFQLAIFN